MKVLRGIVARNDDLYHAGTIHVRIPEVRDPVKVLYVTPYLNDNYGGLIAVPEIGTSVLICQTDNSADWYYMGSIVLPDKQDIHLDSKALDRSEDTEVLPDKRVYRSRGVPQRLVFKSSKGQGLVLSDEYDPSHFNLKAELFAGSGKKLSINDSPEVDSVIIRNEHGDRIKISSRGTGSSAPRSIVLECLGNIDIMSREGAMNLQVVDGKELNIVNTSTGSKRLGPTDPTPGNINIESRYADVNVKTQGEGGDIHLTTEGTDGNIVLRSEQGIVQIHGAKGVDIAGADSSGNVIADIVINGTTIQLN